MKKINKTQMISLSALVAGSMGAYADNGISIVGANEVVRGWEPQTYEIVVDNDVMLTSFQLRMQIPEGFEVIEMPVATQRIPTTGKLQAEWKGGDASTGEMYVGFTKTDLTTFIQGQSGTAVAKFKMRPKPGFELEEQNDGTWSKDVTLKIWDEELTAVDGDEDIAVPVDNADNNDFKIKVVADRIAMYVEPTTTAAYPVGYPVEEVEAEKIPFRLCLDNTIGCSSLSFEIHTKGLTILNEYEATDRLQGGFAIQDQGNGVYKVVCADLTNNQAITGFFGRFVKIFAQVSEGYKGEKATLEVTNIELSDLDGTKVYDGKGFSYEIENLAYTMNDYYWPIFDRLYEDLLKRIREEWTPALEELKYASNVYTTGDLEQKVLDAQAECLNKRNNVELTANDSPNGFIAEIEHEWAELLHNACEWDLNKYVDGLDKYWNGAAATEDTEEMPNVKTAVRDCENADVQAAADDIEARIEALRGAIPGEATQHNTEGHSALVAEAEAIEKAITNVVNYVAIINQVANVEQAIADFEAEVAKLPYAQQYEGDEINELVDAARAWVEATLADAKAKFDEGVLTEEDQVKGAMMEQMQNVAEALNLAAKYDAGRHIFAVVNYWYGNEDEEIEGVKEYVMSVYDMLPEESQEVANVSIENLERELKGLMDGLEDYTYTQDGHAALIEHCAALQELAEEIVADMKAAANEAAWMSIQEAIAAVQEQIDNFDAIVATLTYTIEGEEITAGVDGARTWVEETTKTYEAKYEAGELTLEDGVRGEMMEQIAAVMESINAAAVYDAGRHTLAVNNSWYGNEDEDIEGAKANVLEKIATLPEAGQSALLEQVEMLEQAIKEMWDELNVYQLYNEDTQNWFKQQHEALDAAIADIVAAAAEAANEAAFNRVCADIDLVLEAIKIYEETIQTLMYAQNNEQFDITEAKEWVNATNEKYSKMAENGELDENTDIHQEALGVMSGVYNTLFEAAKWDAQWYYNAADRAYNGSEEDGIEGAKKDIDEKLETLTGEARETVENAKAEIEAALAKMEEDLKDYTAYNYKEMHADIVAQYERIIALINALQGTAAELANAAAWVRIQAQIDEVVQAIANYEVELAKLNYASRVEGGEEAIEVIDAVRQWVEDITAEYEAKYNAGELDEDSGIMGEMKEQLDNVAKALWLAGLYDAGRYYEAALNYLNGDGEDIVGMIDNVLEKMATVAEPGQAALQESIDQIGTLLQEMADALENYTAYSGDANEWFAERYETIINAINDLVAQAAEAANDAALDRVTEQLGTVADYANSVLEIIASFERAGRIEMYSDPVKAVLAWVEAELEAYTARHDSEDKAEWLDETTNVAPGDVVAKNQEILDALNTAANADARNYYDSLLKYYFGWDAENADPEGEDEHIPGIREMVEEKLGNCNEADAEIIKNLMIEVENALGDMSDAVDEYTAYEEEQHAAIVAGYESIMELIDNLSQQTAQAEANNLAAVQAALDDVVDHWKQVLGILEKYETFYGEEGYNVRKNSIDYQIDLVQQAIDNAALAELTTGTEAIKNEIDELAKSASLEESLHMIEVANGLIADAEEALEGPHADKAGLQAEIDDLKAQVEEAIVESEDMTVVASYGEMVENLREIIEDLIGRINDATVILGDLNGDGKVSVADYNKLVRMIVTADDEFDQAEALRVAADVTEDETINVADVSGIINILKGVVNDGPAKAPVAEGINGLEINVTGVSNGVRHLAINLNNDNVISNAQFDIVLPEGIEVVGCQVGERAEDLQLYSNDLGDGRYRVVLTSMEQNTIAAGEGAIVYLNIAGSSSNDIVLDNAIAADVNAVAYALNVDGAQTTGINSITDALVGGAKKIYNMGGQMIDNLKKGVNIIIGEDGQTTKVYKK